MQVGTPSLNIDEIRSFWQSYTDTRRLDAQIDPMIAASWQRCSPRLNPLQFPRWSVLNHDVFALTLRQNGALYNIARPIMEDMYQYCEGAGMALTLSDSTNCILEMLGDPDLVAEGFRLGLRPGSFVDEGRFGTNAFAVALLEGCPVSVFGPEHFLRALHGLSTAAAPIFALEGYPVGTVGIVTPAASYTTLAHGMMIAAARAIENQIQAELLIQNANTQASELNATLQTISDGVLVWSGDGNITHLNQKAGELLRLAPSQVVGRPLTEHIILPEGLARAVILRQELHDVETSLNVNDMAHGCLVSLQIVRDQDDTPLTYIATLRPIEQVRQLVNRLVGAQAHHTLDEMIGQSAAVRRVRRQALMAANAKVTVLLQGESGTGKNTLARAIHNSSQRAGGPFLNINCRAIPRDLMLGEFLGVEAGAFNSGLTSGQPSKFELANGGTLYLSEIDALPFDAQAALLRVIDTGDVIRLGGTRVIPVDVGIITSATRELQEFVAAGTFRADLCFRLSSFVINLVPLRERPDDIPLVIDRALERLSVQFNQSLSLEPEARQRLLDYTWPGNITELESVMDRAASLCDSQVIRLEHLPQSVRERWAVIPGTTLTEPVHSLVEAERRAIVSACRATRGNLTQAAQILGIGRSTLWRKIREMSISSEEFQ